jgi:hypothetical protein
MTPTREDRRQELLKIVRSPGGSGKLSAIYLNALHGQPGTPGLSQEGMIEEILRLEFGDDTEKP